jgi:hypothetical protein
MQRGVLGRLVALHGENQNSAIEYYEYTMVRALLGREAVYSGRLLPRQGHLFDGRCDLPFTASEVLQQKSATTSKKEGFEN